MSRTAHRSAARWLGALVAVSLVAACSPPGDSAPLSEEDAASCKASCVAHATSTCDSQCESSCAGWCVGTMDTSAFAYVDSIDCEGSGIQFHKGGDELTCYP